MIYDVVGLSNSTVAGAKISCTNALRQQKFARQHFVSRKCLKRRAQNILKARKSNNRSKYNQIVKAKNFTNVFPYSFQVIFCAIAKQMNEFRNKRARKRM